MRHATRRWIYRTVPLLGLGLLGLALLPSPDGVHRASWVGTAPKVPDASVAGPAKAEPAAAATDATLTPAAQVLKAALVVPQPADRAAQPMTAIPLKANWTDYLPAGTPTATASTAPASATDGTVGGTPVNGRSGPSTGDGVVFTLAAGEAVKIGESSGGWVHVYRTTGEDGWVYGRYLASGAPSPAAAPSTPSVPKATVASAQANQPDTSGNARLVGRTARVGASVAVRSRPGGDAIFVLEPGERMQIVGARSGWLQVVTEDGSSGWVPG